MCDHYVGKFAIYKPLNSSIVRCICRSAKSAKFRTIQCGCCQVWQHEKCYGIQADDIVLSFRCEICGGSNSNCDKVALASNAGSNTNAIRRDSGSYIRAASSADSGRDTADHGESGKFDTVSTPLPVEVKDETEEKEQSEPNSAWSIFINQRQQFDLNQRIVELQEDVKGYMVDVGSLRRELALSIGREAKLQEKVSELQDEIAKMRSASIVNQARWKKARKTITAIVNQDYFSEVNNYLDRPATAEPAKML